MGIFTTPIARVADDNFRVGNGYKLYFFDAGTTTARATYTDNTYATPHAHPVVASGAGRFPVIWTSGDYKVRLTDASDVLIWEVDNYSTDSGTTLFAQSILSDPSSAADAIVANLDDAPAALADGLQVVVEIQHAANATTTPTFNLNSLGAKTIVRDNDKALVVGDTAGSGYKLYLAFSASLDKWVLLNPAKTTPRKVVYTASGTHTPSAGVAFITFEVFGGGGGGGGANTVSDGGGGGGGAYITDSTSTIASSYTITVGAGGTGGTAGANNGSNGGDSIVTDGASYTLTAGGGVGGTGAGAAGTGGVSSGSSTRANGHDAVSFISGYGFYNIQTATPAASDGVDADSVSVGGSGGNTSGSNQAGGDGFRGEVIVTEYYTGSVEV